MKKFYFDCTDVEANPHDCLVAIPEDKIQSYMENHYLNQNVVKFDKKDVFSEAYYQALDNKSNVVLCELYDSDKIINSLTTIIEHIETDSSPGGWYEGVSVVKYWGNGEPIAVIYASDLDEEYINAVSEKVGHRVVWIDFLNGLFTKQMFDKWRSEIETMYNEIFE